MIQSYKTYQVMAANKPPKQSDVFQPLHDDALALSDLL